MRLMATSAVVLVSVGVLAATTVGGQDLRQTLPMTPLEALVSQPGARTMWSKFVGRLDGRSDSAIVTALAVTTDATAPQLLRGVRIELRHEGARPNCDHKHVEWAVICARENAAIYIEETRFQEFRAEMLTGSAYIRPGHPVGVTHFGGTKGEGTLIAGYLLYGITLQNVADMLDEATAQLKTAPR